MKYAFRLAATLLALGALCLNPHVRKAVERPAEAGGTCPAVDVRPDFMMILDTLVDA